MAVEFVGLENRAAVPSIIAMEALYRLKHHLVIPKIANKTYNTYLEGKIGDRVTVKRPYYARAQAGRRLKKSEMIDKTVDVILDQRFHFALEAVDEDMTINISDYGARYLNSGAEELAYQYDIAGAEELSAGSFYMEGTPGTALTLKQAQFVRAHATKVAIPHGSSCYALLDPLDIAEISADIHDVDNPQLVGENIRASYRGMLAGFNVLESVHVPYLETVALAASVAPLVRGATQRGSEIATDGWPNSTLVLTAGSLIQLAGVGEVQPRGDRRATGNVATFTVMEDVTSSGSGQADINIYPEINAGLAGDTVANPAGVQFDGTTADTTLDASAFQTVTALPADNAVITVIGRATTAKEYRQGMWFCGDALEYVNVELASPKSAVYSGVQRDAETGAAMSYCADFDITDMTETERLDIWFGVKNIYPELVIRHVGEEV